MSESPGSVGGGVIDSLSRALVGSGSLSQYSYAYPYSEPAITEPYPNGMGVCLEHP